MMAGLVAPAGAEPADAVDDANAVNTADAPADIPSEVQWRGVVGLSLAATSGNSNTSALVMNLDLSRLTDEHKTSLTGYINEGKNKVNGQAVTTAGKWGLAGQYDRNLTPDWFAFGKLSFERDRVIDLALRSQTSLGLGYHVYRSDSSTFDVFSGLSRTTERYDSFKTVGDETGQHFVSNGILLGQESTHQLTETVFLKQRLEYYTGLSGPMEQLVKYSASLNVAMTKTMSLSVNLVDTYNSHPANGQKKNDASLLTGVNLKLGE
ncbi:MAG: DUF481 domain-containing protein [Rubrivivax sp.]|nr:MAG: DUF481 domain-containing protein [Rubrivivax sp.]